MEGRRSNLRIKHTGVGNVEGRNMEFLEHDLCHSLPIGRRIPCGFGDKYRVFGWVAAHDLLECMVNQRWYWVKVRD